MEHKNNFNEINKNFLQQIESLREVLPFVSIFADANKIKANKDYVDFVNKHGKKEKDEKNEIYYSFSPEDAHKVSALEENMKISGTASEILPRSLFVSIISQFDSFIGKLIKEIFYCKPEILNSSEKKLSYANLIEIKDIEEAKDYIIESEVESVLRESHSDHFSWLENKLKIPLRKDLNVWSKFVELTERRNLFVHSDGIISSQYLTVCRKNKCFEGNEPILGEKQLVTREYFEESYKTLYEISVKLTQVIWRKILPNDLKKADASLNEICFELIKNHQFGLADNLLIFATEILKKHYNKESRNTFIINKALSLKLGGQKEAAEKIVLEEDWSASSDKFKMARCALLDEFDEVAKFMKKMGTEGDVEKIDYKTWPLFEEFRKTNQFIENFKEIFGEDYSLIETPKRFFDEILRGLNKQKETSRKRNLPPELISISSFIQVVSKYFKEYRFIHYKVELFVQELFKYKNDLTSQYLEKTLKENIKSVEKFNENLIKQSPNQYLNPYTMIRHCLYLENKETFNGILYDIQVKSLEDWLKD